MDAKQFIYVVNNQLMSCAYALSQEMYGRDLSLLADDELIFVVALCDCFYEKYIMEHSSYPITLERPLPGTEAFLSEQSNGSISPDELQELRETIFERYYNYEQEVIRRGEVNGPDRVPFIMSILTFEAAVSTAKAHNRPEPSAKSSPFLDFYIKRVQKLTTSLPGFQTINMQPLRQPPQQPARPKSEKQTKDEKHGLLLGLLLFVVIVVGFFVITRR